jgi:hypothetical protein
LARDAAYYSLKVYFGKLFLPAAVKKTFSGRLPADRAGRRKSPESGNKIYCK